MRALDALVCEAGKRGLYVGIVIYPPEELIDGVIIYVEKGPDRSGALREIAKTTAGSVEEAAQRILDNKKWQK